MTQQVKIGKWKINRDVLLGAGAVATIAIAAATFARMNGGNQRTSASADPFGLGGGSGDTGGPPPQAVTWPWSPPPSSGAGPGPIPVAPNAPSAPALPPPPTSAPVMTPPRAPHVEVATPGVVPAGESGFTFYSTNPQTGEVFDKYFFPAATDPHYGGGFTDPATGVFIPGSQFPGYAGPGPTELPPSPTSAPMTLNRNDVN